MVDSIRLPFSGDQYEKSPGYQALTLDDGSLMINTCTFEENSELRVVPRPGIDRDYDLGSGQAGGAASTLSELSEGRGSYTWEGPVAAFPNGIKIHIAGNEVWYEDPDGANPVDLMEGRLTTTTGKVWFTESLQGGGICLFHDGAGLYAIDTNLDLIKLNAADWAQSTSYTLGNFVVANSKLYRCSDPGQSAASGTGPSGTGDDEVDNTCKWDYVRAEISGYANIPTSLVAGIILLNQYLFVGAADGNIYNSNVGDVYTWTAGDQINAESKADPLTAIWPHYNYVAAFGTKSIQFFYDVAASPGSPLSILEGTQMDVGCLSGNSIAQVDNMLFFVGKTQDFRPGVYMIKGLEYDPVDDLTVGEWLQQFSYPDDCFEGNFVRYKNKFFYVLTHFDQDTNSDSATFVYDVTAKKWAQWIYGTKGYMPFRFAPNGTALPLINLAMGEGSTFYMYQIGRDATTDAAPQYTDVNSDGSALNIACTIVTHPWDNGVSNAKFFHRISVLASEANTATVSVSWRDNEELDASHDPVYSTARTVALEPYKNHLWRCGIAARRRWKLAFNSDPNSLVELSGLDLSVTKSESGSLLQ